MSPPQTRCLLDENVDARLATVLEHLGFEVLRAPKGSSDSMVFSRAITQKAILLTNDTDFANSLLHPLANTAGIVIFSVHPPTLANLTGAVERLLNHVSPADLRGRLCIISHEAILLSS